MTATERLTDVPIRPLWQQAEPNAPIDLGYATIAVGSTSSPPIKGTGRIVFAPRDRLELLIPDTSGDPSLVRHFQSLQDDGTELKFVDSEERVKAMILRVEEKTNVYHPLRSPVSVLRRSASTKETLFHLLNWPDFKGPDDLVLVEGETPLKSMGVCGRLFLKSDPWRITIVATENIRALNLGLKSKGGYAITHVGKIEREDGQTYSFDDADSLLAMLHTYMSFALGRWAGPQLSVGFDSTGTKTFERWGLAHISSGAWNGDATWIDLLHSECLREAFPGFAELWKREVWRQPMHDVIYWYVAASRLGDGVNVDSALLFTQAALELLA